jgi:hypothetical protein
VRALKLAGVVVVAAVLLLVGLYFAMAERVEVVVLHTHDATGDHATRLWIVDLDGHAWLRTGAENRSWLPRLRANPGVELERGGATAAYTAAVVDDAATVARVNELTLQKYGWSEKLLRAGGTEPGGQVAIRLDPAS